MPEISQNTQKLISSYRLWRETLKPREGVPTIHVDEFASKVAAFYEKIRTVVDWKEEHLMRRAAIIRKLKRRFLNGKMDVLQDQETIAEPLVLELIRGGHFPNDRIEESKITDVKNVLRKYSFIIKNSPEPKARKDGLQFLNWILEIAACEIEETLYPFIRENALINYMFEAMQERISLSEKSAEKISIEEKNIQIYIAVQQALFKLDKPIISYNLIRYKYPLWRESPHDWLLEASKNINKIWQAIERDFDHPLGKKFYAICEKYDTPYLLLGDALSEEPNLDETMQKLSDPENLEGMISKFYKKRLSTIRSRVFRAAIYSTISILVTHIFSFLVIEQPLARLIMGKFYPITIVVNILGPTILMLLLTVTIRSPSKSNFSMVLSETSKIIYKNERQDIYEIKIPKRKKGLFIRSLIFIFYCLGAVVSFGLLFLGLEVLHFPPTSIIINFIFIALIAFAGLAIRKRMQELTIEEKIGGIWGFIADFLLLPVAATGKWLSNKWKKYNAIAAFFNALIDMPFSTFIEFIEQWRFFLKEKKEEIH
jgi:hypothetical protein